MFHNYIRSLCFCRKCESIFRELKNVFFLPPEGLKTLIWLLGLVDSSHYFYFAASGTDGNLEAMRAKGLEAASRAPLKTSVLFLNYSLYLNLIA